MFSKALYNANTNRAIQKVNRISTPPLLSASIMAGWKTNSSGEIRATISLPETLSAIPATNQAAKKVRTKLANCVATKLFPNSRKIADRNTG